MSSSSTARPRAALSSRMFSHLSSILTASNARFRAVAASARAAQTPTHHARKRASALGLGVNITLAVNCPAHQVAVVPLPIIDTTPSPVLAAAESSASKGRGRIPHLRPALRLDIPRDVTGTASASALFNTISLDSGVPAPVAAPGAPLGGMLPWQAYKDPAYLLPSRRAPEPPVVPLDADEDDEFAGLELAYPHSGAANNAPSVFSLSSASSCSGSSAVDSSSSSTASSSGPTTPTDAEMAPSVNLRGKRKGITIDLDDALIYEKRPKYERKQWIRSSRILC